MALFLATLSIAGSVGSSDHRKPWQYLGRDFLVSYCAGTVARQGNFELLYRFDQFGAVQQQVAHSAGVEDDDRWGAWLNPPFYALAWTGLSSCSYAVAWAVWLCFGMLAIIVSALLLARMLLPEEQASRGMLEWRTAGLVPVLLLLSMPAFQTLCSGQNSALSLLLLTLVVTLWRSGHALASGLVAGLLFYKPQLGALVSVVLIVNLGRRALIGVGITGLLLLLVTLLAAPGALDHYLRSTGPTLQHLRESGRFVWNRHVTFNAFWHYALQGRIAFDSFTAGALTALCVAGFALPLLVLVWRARASASPARSAGPSRDRLIAATITTMPLLMPYYVDYDLLLLAVPLVLFVRGWLHECSGAGRVSDRWIARSWLVLYLWLFLNPGLTGQTQVNFGVIALSIVCAQTIRRALQRNYQDEPVQLRAAVPFAAAA